MLNTILNILTSGLPCCLLALGIFLTYRILDFADLTAEGSFLIGACVTCGIIHSGGSAILGTVLGCLSGAVCGAITGFLNRILKIPKLLSGIITLTACGAIALVVLGTFDDLQSSFNNSLSINYTAGGSEQSIFTFFWHEGDKLNYLYSAIIMAAIVAVVVLALYFFFGTEYGMAIRTTGLNENMARSQGINTTIASIVGVAISNGLIGLAGSLYVQQELTIDVGDAAGYLVVGLASILIGEALFGKRSFKNWLISVSLGAIAYFTISQIVIKLFFPTQLKGLLYAILITIALCLPQIKKSILTIWFKVFKKGEKKNAEAQ